MNSRPAFAAEASSRIPDAGYHLISALKKFPFAFWRSLRETKNPFPFSRELKGIARCGLLVTRHPPRPGRGPSPAIRHQAFVHVHLQVHESFHLPPSTPRPSREAAFSLTEVVIALGIFAISMVGVLALFPVASATGRESSEETQAAILAETIISDLRTSTSAKGKAGGWIVRGPNTFNASQWLRPVTLTNVSTNFVVYDLVPRVNSSGPDGVGMIGQPVALKAIFTNLSSATYSNAINSTSAVFGSRISVEPLTNLPGLALVTVTVDSPVSANFTNRRSYSFPSLLSAP